MGEVGTVVVKLGHTKSKNDTNARAHEEKYSCDVQRDHRQILQTTKARVGAWQKQDTGRTQYVPRSCRSRRDEEYIVRALQ